MAQHTNSDVNKGASVPDRTPWPRELMHDELCAWRFGMNAECDCKVRQAVTRGC